VEDVLSGQLPDLDVPRDRDLHRSEPERVMFGALDLLPRDALPSAFRVKGSGSADHRLCLVGHCVGQNRLPRDRPARGRILFYDLLGHLGSPGGGRPCSWPTRAGVRGRGLADGGVPRTYGGRDEAGANGPAHRSPSRMRAPEGGRWYTGRSMSGLRESYAGSMPGYRTPRLDPLVRDWSGSSPTHRVDQHVYHVVAYKRALG